MNQYEMNNIERNYEGVMGIEGEKRGIYYILDEDRTGIVICGEKGMTLLNKEQALSISDELRSIMEMYF